MRSGVRIATGIGMLGLAAALPVAQAVADPWIPPAGDGVTKPMIRFFSGNRSFPANGFTTGTVPASNETTTQFRITGVQGLGDGFSLEYDLRAARTQTSSYKHHKTITSTASGLQDQEIGLNYGLTQTPSFAQSIEFNVIAPTGRTKPSPSLGTGRWSVEPDYQLGLVHGPFSLSLIAGPRVFLDGGATQLRATLYLSVRPFPRVTLSSEIFVARTIQQARTLPPGAQGELYNLLRVGVGAEYRLTQRFRPFIAYETNVAGQGIHAGNRITVGVAVHF